MKLNNKRFGEHHPNWQMESSKSLTDYIELGQML